MEIKLENIFIKYTDNIYIRKRIITEIKYKKGLKLIIKNLLKLREV